DRAGGVVGHGGVARHPTGADLVRGLLQRAGPPGGEDDVVAGRREQPSDLAADAATAAGDERNPCGAPGAAESLGRGSLDGPARLARLTHRLLLWCADPTSDPLAGPFGDGRVM